MCSDPSQSSQDDELIESLYFQRALNADQTPDWTLGPFIIQAILLLVAPALYAASIYMELGRIIALTEGESYSLIRLKWLTKIFVGGDILSFLVQAAGQLPPTLLNTANLVHIGNQG